jgi:lactoylglutathione lyase
MKMNQSRAWIRVAGFTGLVLSAFALGGYANQKTDAPTNFATNTVDIGMVVSDLEKSLKFYKDVLGFTEVPGFKVPGEFAIDAGLANKLELDVHVLVLGQGETSTKLKLMEFKANPGARVDNTFIHSSIGFRYLTVAVKNLNSAVDHANKAGGKLVAKCPVPLPKGFPAGLGLANYRDPDGNLVEFVGPWKQ